MGTLTVPLALGVAAAGAATQAANERAVRVTGTVAASPAEVWRAFTTSDGVQSFFAQKANIQLAVGGPYEIFFNPKDERQGTKGLKILSYAPEEMVSFEWNAPPQFPAVCNGGMWVVIQMHSRARRPDRGRHLTPRLEIGRGMGRGVPAFRAGLVRADGQARTPVQVGPDRLERGVDDVPEAGAAMNAANPPDEVGGVRRPAEGADASLHAARALGGAADRLPLRDELGDRPGGSPSASLSILVGHGAPPEAAPRVGNRCGRC
ncbi:MAG TPA: SRPBCC domain-containing protein [Burkholderiales bacterium]|nr:SRPBCC domain-containing protein [Burkholderiales bacterium]